MLRPPEPKIPREISILVGGGFRSSSNPNSKFSMKLTLVRWGPFMSSNLRSNFFTRSSNSRGEGVGPSDPNSNVQKFYMPVGSRVFRSSKPKSKLSMRSSNSFEGERGGWWLGSKVLCFPQTVPILVGGTVFRSSNPKFSMNPRSKFSMRNSKSENSSTPPHLGPETYGEHLGLKSLLGQGICPAS